MTDALDAVIDGVLERALLGDDARRHFALAGALDRARSTASADNSGSRWPDQETHNREGNHSTRNPTHALGAALLSTVAIGALGSTGASDIDLGAWSPGGSEGDPQPELVAAGAAVACRRFDIAPETVATRSGVPPERLTHHRVDGDVASGSE